MYNICILISNVTYLYIYTWTMLYKGLHCLERRVKCAKLVARANNLYEMNFMNELRGNLPQLLCE